MLMPQGLRGASIGCLAACAACLGDGLVACLVCVGACVRVPWPKVRDVPDTQYIILERRAKAPNEHLPTHDLNPRALRLRHQQRRQEARVATPLERVMRMQAQGPPPPPAVGGGGGGECCHSLLGFRLSHPPTRFTRQRTAVRPERRPGRIVRSIFV